ncbi:WbqC family protein [Amycolatopsis nigrescens]|uniref:WbqC family protein n=1 Tax=Amycolatopsis nigrescens TaxID=381445 RepID=UPI0009FC67B4|nr:WbqC family protein [Amycolatopsis nigrescens]
MGNHLVCAIHQPNLFPRLSTLGKLSQADVWVVLDDVQFNARDYQHRTRLAGLDDPAHQQWLTVPVHRPHGRDSRINELVLAEPEKSRRRIDQLVRQYYGRARHWADVAAVVDEVSTALLFSARIADVAEVSARALLSALGWRGRVVRSSELPARAGRSIRLADLTAAVGATEYLCGRGGAKYLDERPFAELDLDVRYVAPVDRDMLPALRRVGPLWELAAQGIVAMRAELAARYSRVNL